MPGEITRSGSTTKYTITNSYWICEWILSDSKYIQRSCHLNNDTDPLDPGNSDYLMSILPGLFKEVQEIIRKWISEGDANASLLLLPENKPSFIDYAEKMMGLKIIL
jgi:hypothetical protein